jgi:plastocyanin
MKGTFTKLLVISVLLITITSANVNAKKFIITVQDFSFSPSSIPDVVVGDTIHWTWVSGFHTTTSTTIPAGAAIWDNEMTSTSTSFEYKVTLSGVYHYKCTIHELMGMVATFTATGTLGIVQQASVFGNMLLSPNPAAEYVRVSFNPLHPFTGSVKLFDILGNNLWKSEDYFDAGSDFTEINLANIPKGVYFVELSDDRNDKVVKRLIIR